MMERLLAQGMDRRGFLEMIVDTAVLLAGCATPGKSKRDCSPHSNRPHYGELPNYLVLDMDGKPHDYKSPRAPVLNVSFRQAERYAAGMVNYLKRAHKPALLAFGAWHCAPCIRDIPHLNGIHQKYGKKLQVVSVNYAEEKTLREYITESKRVERTHHVQYPSLMMLEEYMWPTITGAGVPANELHLPVNMLVDQNMKVQFHTGFLDEELWDGRDNCYRNPLKELHNALETMLAA